MTGGGESEAAMNEERSVGDPVGAIARSGGARRGYDPDQVDRFVAEQQRRLDATLERATEAERKLASAMSQLREMRQRVGELEAELEERSRPAQPAQPLDTLGERVQRIVQEAWDGAFALRESVEREVAERREQAVEEAKDLVASARRKAQAIEEEIERRRRAYLERLEEDRARASAQIAHLRDERAGALEELRRVRDSIDLVVGEVIDAKSAPSEPEPATMDEIEDPPSGTETDDDLPATMPVHRLEGISVPADDNERANLVRSHRESVRFTPSASISRPAAQGAARPATSVGKSQASVFDFEQA